MKNLPRILCRVLLAVLLAGAGLTAGAQQIDTRFSCSAERNDGGETVTYADNAEIRLDGDRIQAFRWESDLYRTTHGFDCSIDESDGLKAEVVEEQAQVLWRVLLMNPQAARERRGYDFDRLPRCSIRLERKGDTLDITPSCPALCGSRGNFTQLSVNLKSGKCQYGK
jgi:hypothetical protein